MATEADFERIGNYARMYNKDQGIDRHLCTRTTEMKVLVLSISRTGTLSMQSALSTLGLANPYHLSSMYDNIGDTTMWLEAFDAQFRGIGTFEREQWDALLGHCGAVTDMPANIFGPELAAAYPDAKIILTERDVDK
ncbi:hypothetical protein EJ05DRAFT_501877 [Pseudovirgaria hyperparasitica]|uniref:P-loop containing nucleoside triphosphate hydrolase protein n=1 Tax=Pseudovirgaria hyperparasitica TaxID=470096 RepID=A0A6A6W0D8_9PEZI|nr:uncharacterized protein EJ05DRAFT_501877 [Pseudovirgaria hyperparasitica]KAF2756372.1 hypothetical protein EJ05DRAFT_501877 [Pseudovirgaria hyperparasitica]